MRPTEVVWLCDECSRGFFIYLLPADKKIVEADLYD